MIRSERPPPKKPSYNSDFGIGPDDKHIAIVDADGVALAAIQGLNQKVDVRIQELEEENARLKARLETLEPSLALLRSSEH